MCTKRRFLSEKDAKQAHRRASYRIRVYRCPEPDCRGFHVTANEKRTSGGRRD